MFEVVFGLFKRNMSMFEAVFSVIRQVFECLIKYLDEHVGEFEGFSCGRNV